MSTTPDVIREQLNAAGLEATLKEFDLACRWDGTVEGPTHDGYKCHVDGKITIHLWKRGAR